MVDPNFKKLFLHSNALFLCFSLKFSNLAELLLVLVVCIFALIILCSPPYSLQTVVVLFFWVLIHVISFSCHTG